MATKIEDPSEPLKLWYGYGGDTWDTFSEKYSVTIPYIFEVLNALNGTGTLPLPVPSGGRVFHGNADTATKLQTARKISLAGGATGSAMFDGSADITINITVLDASKLTGTPSAAWLAAAPFTQFGIDSEGNYYPKP